MCFGVFDLLERYDWFDLLLDELISCKLHLSHVPASVHLNEWNREVATQAGRSFAATLITHSISENGVAEWIVQCEGLRYVKLLNILIRYCDATNTSVAGGTIKLRRASGPWSRRLARPS